MMFLYREDFGVFPLNSVSGTSVSCEASEHSQLCLRYLNRLSDSSYDYYNDT